MAFVEQHKRPPEQRTFEWHRSPIPTMREVPDEDQNSGDRPDVI